MANAILDRSFSQNWGGLIQFNSLLQQSYEAELAQRMELRGGVDTDLVEATESQEMEEEDERRMGEAYLRTAMEEEIVEFLFNEEETIVD